MGFNEIMQTGFAVVPKTDCEHVTPAEIARLSEFVETKTEVEFAELECGECKSKEENWVCLSCCEVGCSRYVNSHMVKHNEVSHHPVALSLTDASFWCYACLSYIDLPPLRRILLSISDKKHKIERLQKEEKEKKELKEEQKTKEQKEEEEINKQRKAELEEVLKREEDEEVRKELERLSMKEHPRMSDLVSDLNNKKYSKVVVMCGAGLSVAAGIPDFRTPGTGLYSKLQQYNLPTPEAIFSIQYFREHPEVFVSFAKDFFKGGQEPTLGHRLIAELDKRGFLLKCFTQNIDDLELKAGVKEANLMQAHGHSRTAHCIDCKKEFPIEQFRANIEKEQVTKCECSGLVKPDVVFFGEQLPKDFASSFELIKKTDLVFIIGTSLRVMPFAFLAETIPEEVPVVLINNEDSLELRTHKVWLRGNIEDNARDILTQLKWI